MFEEKISMVILDWAGTTIDFGCFAPLSAFMRAFANAGIGITAREARAPMGLEKKQHIREICRMERIQAEWKAIHGRLYEESDIEKLYNDFEPTLLQVLKNYAQPIPGVVDTIAAMREKHIRIGSTTGYTSEMMRVVMEEASRSGYRPDNTVTPDMVGKGRPYPYMCWKNAIDMDIPMLSNIIKVGDTIADIREGVNAGIWSVGVIYGSSELGLTQDEIARMDPDTLTEKVNDAAIHFREAGAHFVIDQFSDLLFLIDKVDELLAEGVNPGNYER